jgi:hypothetical protein
VKHELYKLQIWGLDQQYSRHRIRFVLNARKKTDKYDFKRREGQRYEDIMEERQCVVFVSTNKTGFGESFTNGQRQEG